MHSLAILPMSYVHIGTLIFFLHNHIRFKLTLLTSVLVCRLYSRAALAWSKEKPKKNKANRASVTEEQREWLRIRRDNDISPHYKQSEPQGNKGYLKGQAMEL